MGMLKTLMTKPGVVKDNTPNSTGKQWTDADRVRFVRGLPQKIGGWEKNTPNTFNGICRGMRAWIDTSAFARLAVGTHTKLYVLEGDDFLDLTPFRATSSLTDPFTTTSGSAEVTVTDVGHLINQAGEFVDFDGASAVGGITIDGNYAVTEIVDDDNYKITHTAAASSSTTGGGSVTASYEIYLGRADAEEGKGYGVGTYGNGTYGTARSSFIKFTPRTWAIDTWGQYLVACPRDGSIFEWQLDNSARAAVISNAPTPNAYMFVTDDKHMVALGAGGDPMKVEWCDQDDNTNWTVSDQTTAGGRELVGGTRLLSGTPARNTNLIFSDSSVWTMTFRGGAGVFGFDRKSVGSSGIIGPHAFAEVDGIVYWMGQKDFYYFDGVVKPIKISDDLRQSVFDNLTEFQKDKCWAMVHTAFSEIWFLYPTTTEITTYAVYNYREKVMYPGTLARTAGIDVGVFSKPIMADPNGQLYDHESGNDDDGSAMNEYIVGPVMDIGDGGEFLEILELIPDFKSLTGSVDLTLLAREYPQDEEFEEFVGSVSANTDKLDPRLSGRQVQLKISSDRTGTDWRFGTVKLNVQGGSER